MRAYTNTRPVPVLIGIFESNRLVTQHSVGAGRSITYEDTQVAKMMGPDKACIYIASAPAAKGASNIPYTLPPKVLCCQSPIGAIRPFSLPMFAFDSAMDLEGAPFVKYDANSPASGAIKATATLNTGDTQVNLSAPLPEDLPDGSILIILGARSTTKSPQAGGGGANVGGGTEDVQPGTPPGW